MLSIPPTPGSSIARRANIANLFNAGNVFARQNYDLSFIYGGYSYFDNMHQFFSSNGYRCIDRLDFRKDQITFANIWGIPDEDLFNKSIDYYDEQCKNKKPFFSILLTTSNYRTYNFPANRIDLPKLAILGPKHSNSLYQIADEGQKLVSINDEILSQAIAFYQSAYLLFKSDQIKEF